MKTMQQNTDLFSYNRNSLIKDGKPWLPILGEFHYARYPHVFWREELSRIKAGGVDIVSTYVFWIHHEEKEGEYDFSGNRDLRLFLHEAQRAGLYVFLRIGPWCHGEVRGGGLPDWVWEKECEARSNDAEYLQTVEKWFRCIGRKVEGLLHQDGGPIIGIQIENEYGCCGGLAGEEGERHMRRLTGLAESAGLKAPFMTATGWGGAHIADLLPVMGGYCDAPWEQTVEKLPPSANFVFSPKRNDEEIGSDYAGEKQLTFDSSQYPYLTAELGGGLQPTKMRRPIATARDIGAMSLVKLGSGANLLGYYMYHGGTNPRGKYSALQESTETGSYCDLAEFNYDFQAPIGEFGQIRESFKEIRMLSLFLHDFGEELCQMKPYFGEERLEDAKSRELRTCVRARENRGYLFVNNYQRMYSMKDHVQKELTVELDQETLVYPPRDIEDGEYFFYPFHMPIGDRAELITALAVPLCILKRKEGNTYVFYSDTEPMYRIEGDMGANTILTLSRREAQNACKAEFGGEEYLLIGEGVVRVQEKKVILEWQSDENGQKASFSAWPRLPFVPDGFGIREGEGLTKYECVKGQKDLPQVSWKEQVDEDGNLLCRVFLDYPQETEGGEYFLQMDYIGESAQLLVGGEVKTDHLYTGGSWIAGMRRYADPRSVILKISPLMKDQPIYLEEWPETENAAACSLLWIKAYRRQEYVLWEEKPAVQFLAPLQNQSLTDIALHFKWTRTEECAGREYVLELSENEDFSKAVQMHGEILKDSEVGYYFPKREELPKREGRYYVRVREKGRDKWSETLTFTIHKEHERVPVKRRIDREHPWFTIFDYSEHDPCEVWELLPESVREYVGMGLIASYKAPADQIIEYMLNEDAKGYLWHLGALGPHETQFGKYTITSLCEIEYVLQHAHNLVSIGFVEQYLGTKEEEYWRNEYFFRLLALCAQYGITFIYSDGNRNYMELAAMIKRPFFMDRMRSYADYFIFSFKQNHSHAAYSCFGAVLGAWMDGACCQIGVQPENWYWNDAGFRDQPGECYGYLQGNEQQIPAGMTVEMLLTGLAMGAAHYSCEGESWLIQKGANGRLTWSEQGIAAISFWEMLVRSKCIPSRQEVLSKIKLAVDFRGYRPGDIGDAWEGGILRKVFDRIYHIENDMELFPREPEIFHIPVVPDRREGFKGIEVLDLDQADEEAVHEKLRKYHVGENRQEAWHVNYPEVLLIMHGEENTEMAKRFDIDMEEEWLSKIHGELSLWQYLVIGKRPEGILLHLYSERGKTLNLQMKFRQKPVITGLHSGIQVSRTKDGITICMKGTGRPAELLVLKDKGSRPFAQSTVLEGALQAAGKEKLVLLSDMAPDKVEAEGGVLPARNCCANQRYGKLPLSVDHLRYSHGLSLGRNTRMSWNLNMTYKRLTFQYGFDIDAWMPRIIDRDTIIWDRAEKVISMRLRIYGDGRELFCSPRLSDTAGTRTGEADLSGVSCLELVFEGDIASEDPQAQVYLDLLNPVIS